MKASSFFTNSKEYLHTANQQYLDATKEWFFKTPERALNQACNAALTIKSIEDEYFQSGKISRDSTDCSDYLMSFVRADFERELTIAKLRLAEFKASCLVLGVPVSAHLEKLSFLDGVLAKYVSQKNDSAVLAALPPAKTVDSNPANSQPEPVNAGVFHAAAVGNSVPEAIAQVKPELNSKVEAGVAREMQNPKIRISALITSTAIKYTVLLVLLPLLYQQLSKHFFQPASTANLQQELELRSHKPE